MDVNDLPASTINKQLGAEQPCGALLTNKKCRMSNVQGFGRQFQIKDTKVHVSVINAKSQGT